MSSIRVVLVLAATLDLEVEQMDVKTAFFFTMILRKKFTWSSQRVFRLKVKKIMSSG